MERTFLSSAIAYCMSDDLKMADDNGIKVIVKIDGKEDEHTVYQIDRDKATDTIIVRVI